MEKVHFTVTLCFQEPFWIGIYERESNKKYEVCRIVFGGEPKDYEAHDFLLKNFEKLRFSPPTDATPLVKQRINPKRMQRQVKKEIQTSGIGTKAQQALKLQLEQKKTERKKHTREQREAEKERQFQLKQQKRKEKHRGH
ncbi:YjdF family protein [Anaerotignum sp.]|uniref:YjdF family protein n=1 Tax=Anaerotignum sp. TaxID=2039241 RepID=UPI0028AF463F|nr:YjdF family protein [Anaerotignum sp.]